MADCWIASPTRLVVVAAEGGKPDSADPVTIVLVEARRVHEVSEAVL